MPGSLASPQDMSFPSGLVGYIGLSNNSVNCLLKTTDGGLSWSFLPLPAANNIWSLYFINELEGFAGMNSGALMKTNDGGISWTLQSTQLSNINFIYFISSTRGFLSNNNGASKTVDGGNSWYSTFPNVGTVKSMYYQPTLNLLYAGGYYASVARTDSIASGWLSLFSILEPEYMFSICSPSDSIIIGVGSTGTLYRSTNAGGTWSNVQTGYPYTIRDTYFFNDTLAFSCGDRATILKSTDGFVTETRKYNLANVQLRKILFTSADTGYACGSGRRILKTVNGGQSWLPTFPNSGTTIFTDIEFTGKDTGYVSYLYESILKTTNAGATWDTIHATPGSIHDLNDMHFFDDTTLIVSGTYTFLQRSTDAGLTFQPCVLSGNFSGSPDLSRFSFPSATVGYVIGEDSTFLRTTDGGLNWTKLYFPESSINNVKFINDLEGYLLTPHKLYHTSDGGQSFSVDSIPSNQSMFELHINSSGYVYVMGTGGAILTNDPAYITSINLFPKPITQVQELNVFPNPSNSTFQFQLEPEIASEISLLTITDITGKVYYSTRVAHQQNVSLNLPGLRSGLYLLQLKNNKGAFVTKLIKKGD